MQNLKKLLLVGLLAISLFAVLSPTALAACPTVDATTTSCKVWCPGSAGDPRTGDTTRNTAVQQIQYTYTWDAYQIDSNITHCPLSSTADFVSAINRIFSIGAAIVAIISGIFILIAAFMYVSSHGDTEKVEGAKSTIIYAIMGLIVAGIAWGIPVVVRSLIF